MVRNCREGSGGRATASMARSTPGWQLQMAWVMVAAVGCAPAASSAVTASGCLARMACRSASSWVLAEHGI